MKIIARVAIVLTLVLIGIAMGWPLKPSHAGGPADDPHCAKPPEAACGDKTIVVHSDGLHGRDNEVFLCEGDSVDWQVDDAEGKVTDFTVHFDESPFDPSFGSGDYCAGRHCSGHERGTNRLEAHARAHGRDYVRCHRYNLALELADGSKRPIDPHIIVGSAGSGH